MNRQRFSYEITPEGREIGLPQPALRKAIEVMAGESVRIDGRTKRGRDAKEMLAAMRHAKSLLDRYIDTYMVSMPER